MNTPPPLVPAVEYMRRHISHEMVSNERFVLLLSGAGAVVLLSILIALWNLTSDMSQRLVTSKDNLARMQAEVAGDAWPKRLETSQALKSQLTVRFWPAPTAGLAEASFETWIRGHFTRHGGEPQQIQIARSPVGGRDGQQNPSLSGIQRMTAKVLAPFDQEVLIKVLADAAEDPQMLIVDRLIIRSGVNSRLEMDISTFIRANTPQGAPGAAP